MPPRFNLPRLGDRFDARSGNSYAAYLEAVLGYGRKTARERIRTALALSELPALADALADGEISWTHVRELSRVATSDTELDWLAAARGQSAREVAEMVAGLARGDRPGTLADRSELSRGRPGYQVAVSRCDDCGRTFAEADGHSVQLDPALVAAIDCDHTAIPRSLEGRATQTIPPAVRRAVVRAFHGRCAMPGCRNATWLDVHHLRPRSSGGDHAPENLLLLCSAHHRRIHDGSLVVERIGGRQLLIRHADGTPYQRDSFWRWSAPALPG